MKGEIYLQELFGRQTVHHPPVKDIPDRQLYDMYTIQNLPVEVIAERVGCSAHTVKRQVRRLGLKRGCEADGGRTTARQRIRQAMAVTEPPEASTTPPAFFWDRVPKGRRQHAFSRSPEARYSLCRRQRSSNIIHPDSQAARDRPAEFLPRCPECERLLVICERTGSAS